VTSLIVGTALDVDPKTLGDRLGETGERHYLADEKTERHSQTSDGVMAMTAPSLSVAA